MIVFTVDLKNQPGELAHMCDALAQRGVNIMMAGLSTGDHGLISLTASDEAAARAALNEARVSFTEHPALQVKMVDRPGEVARVARILSEAHINVESFMPTSICDGEVTVAICVDKLDEARRALDELVV